MQQHDMPALTMVRIVCTMIVLSVHAGLVSGADSWAVLPLFFVLSGFLITKQLDRGIPLGKFWRRRALRIVPTLFICLTVSALLAIATGSWPTGYQWHFALLSNHYIAATWPSTPGGPIGHLWSVAAEAQFYLTWPLLFLALPRRRVALCLAIIVAAPLWRLAQSNAYDAALLLPGCMDLFAAGALVALRPDRATRWAMFGLGLACLGAYAALGAGVTTAWIDSVRYLYTPYALIFAPIIAVIAAPGFWKWRVAPPRWAGDFTYGLYVWQMLAFRIADEAGMHLLGVPLAFALAWLTWRYVETPLHASKPRSWSRSSTVAMAARDSASTVAPPAGTAIAAATGPGPT